MLTLQEIFDKAYLHLMKQGEQATLKTEGQSRCQYLTPDGKKCGVGCLLKEGTDTSGFEDASIANFQGVAELGGHLREKALKLKDALVASDIDMDDIDTVMLLREIQNIHDSFPWAGATWRGYWKSKFKTLADNMGLTIPTT